ncbi:MAG: hypothetical protein R3D62_02115 [Xanthobacteraceae bacterium]
MSDPLPAAELVHTMPGRARLRIADKRGDATFFTALAAKLAALPGVFSVDVRPLTGSVVIAHGPAIAQIGDKATQAGLFTLVEHAEEEPVSWPAPPLDPRHAATIALGLIAFWQLLQGRIFPPALTTAWYAAHLAGLSGVADHPEDAE